MGKFIYCHGIDELKWNVPKDWPFTCRLTKDYLDSKKNMRHNIKNWIEKNCKNKVYAWNECIYVNPGETNYKDKLQPGGNVSLYFSKRKDLDKFLLSIDYVEWMKNKDPEIHY